MRHKCSNPKTTKHCKNVQSNVTKCIWCCCFAKFLSMKNIRCIRWEFLLIDRKLALSMLPNIFQKYNYEPVPYGLPSCSSSIWRKLRCVDVHSWNVHCGLISFLMTLATTYRSYRAALLGRRWWMQNVTLTTCCPMSTYLRRFVVPALPSRRQVNKTVSKLPQCFGDVLGVSSRWTVWRGQYCKAKHFHRNLTHIAIKNRHWKKPIERSPEIKTMSMKGTWNDQQNE